MYNENNNKMKYSVLKHKEDSIDYIDWFFADKKRQTLSFPNDSTLIDENRKDNNMSILVAEIIENKIFMMADSRSTKMEGEQFPHNTYNDAYNKITYLQDLNILIGSTGLNDFEGQTIEELVEDVWNKCKSIIMSNTDHNKKIDTYIQQINQQIETCVKLTGIPTIIVYGYYWEDDSSVQRPHIGFFDIRPNGIKYNDIIRKNSLLSFGDDFTIQMLEKIYVPKLNDAKTHFTHYKEVLETIISLESNYFTNSVIGGPIKSKIIDINGEIII